MGKRSAFPRIDRDLYNTPPEAVTPLLRCLRPETPFWEPCFGKGHLAAVLSSFGHRFLGGFDLPIDARCHRYGEMGQGEVFITNPPYWGKRADLHPLIMNLSDQAPTWLLMSSDWLFNRSSGPLCKRVRQIVAVGRVKWIPGSEFTGKDNAAWILFDPRGGIHTSFVGRA
jgi:hypothetical protein